MRVSSVVEQRSHTPYMHVFESHTRYHVVGCEKGARPKNWRASAIYPDSYWVAQQPGEPKLSRQLPYRGR